MIIFSIVCPPWQPEECLLTYPRYRPSTGQYLSIRILNGNEVMKDKINRSIQVKSYCKIRIINAIGRASCVLSWELVCITVVGETQSFKSTFLGYPLLLSTYDMASSNCLQKSISCQHSCDSKPIHTWITEYTRTRCYFQCVRNLLVFEPWTILHKTNLVLKSWMLNTVWWHYSKNAKVECKTIILYDHELISVFLTFTSTSNISFPLSWKSLQIQHTESTDTLAYAGDHVLYRLIQFLEDAESAGRSCFDMPHYFSICGAVIIDIVSK